MSLLKQHILDASFRLFRENGYHSVSVNDIIRAAGVSKGGFYHHFKSKENLLEIIFDKWLKNHVEILQNSLAENTLTVRDRIQNIINLTFQDQKGALDLFADNSKDLDINSLIAVEALNTTPDLAGKASEVLEALVEGYTDLFKAGQQEGIVKRTVDPRSAAETLISLYEGLRIFYLFNPTLDLNSTSYRIYRFFWESIKR